MIYLVEKVCTISIIKAVVITVCLRTLKYIMCEYYGVLLKFVCFNFHIMHYVLLNNDGR